MTGRSTCPSADCISTGARDWTDANPSQLRYAGHGLWSCCKQRAMKNDHGSIDSGRRGRLAWQRTHERRHQHPNEMLLAARAVGLRYVDPTRAGHRRRRAGSGFSYRRRRRQARDRRGDAGTHPGNRDPAGMDRRLDLPRHRAATSRRRAATRAGAGSTDTTRSGSRLATQTKYERTIAFASALPRLRRRVDARPATPGIAAREGPGRDRPAARDDADPGRQRGVRARQPLVRPDHAARPARAGHAARGLKFTLPRQGRQGARRRPPGQAAGTRREVDARTCPASSLFQYVDDGRRRPGGRLGRRQRIPARGDGRRLLGQGLPDLGGHGARRPRAAGARERTIRPSRRTPALGRPWREVAAELGNTPAVCRRCYIHPRSSTRTLTEAWPTSCRGGPTASCARGGTSLRAG